jgi:demethylmenaquinone methyltransferase/2-methoxy-6-polyprenyl-1,4-benzoquinol methylase
MNEDYYSYIKKCFKIWAPIYDYVNVFTFAIRTKVVSVTNTEKGSKILDVATGTGKQAFAFGERGYEVVGIDLSEDMLKVANKKNRHRHVRFVVADATKMPFEANYFDVSCISFALHDMPLPIREKVLEEIVRVTKPEGTVVIVDYALPRNRVVKYLVYRFVGSYESRYYPQFIGSDLKALVRRCGIEIEKDVSVMFGSARILKAINEKKHAR